MAVSAFFLGLDMNDIRHHLRLPAIVLLTIVGLSSMAGDAKAAATGKFARECCLKRSCTVCCCKPAGSLASTPPIRQAGGFLPAERSVSAPSLPCECRASDPASGSPSQRDSRSLEDRAEVDGGVAVS